MGAVVETPSIYPDMTAEENLCQQYLVLGMPSNNGIPALLRLVGLEDTGKKKVKHFSLGMRQRLGIAMALAGKPDFLVLDEPVNGLDPEGIDWFMDFILLAYVVLVPILTSVLTALFVGSDYSSGTLRNKVIAGHRRSHIYLANLITCCCAGIILCAAFVLPLGLLGRLLGGQLQASLAALLQYMGLSLVLLFAFTALLTLIAMLCQTKSHTVAGCILLVFALIFLGVYITSALNEPEYYSGYSFTENGMTVEEEETTNPNYVGGTKRQVYEFLQDFTPGGQVLQLSEMDAEAPGMLALYDGIILLGATGFGLAFFRRKDLK